MKLGPGFFFFFFLDFFFRFYSFSWWGFCGDVQRTGPKTSFKVKPLINGLSLCSLVFDLSIFLFILEWEGVEGFSRKKKGCIYRGPTGLEHRLQLGPFGSHQLWPLEARGMIWETFPLSRECFLPVTQPWPGNPHRTACNCLYPLGLRQGKGYPPGRLGRSRLSLRTCKLPPRALTGGSRSQGRTQRTQTAHASVSSRSCKK